MNKLTRFDFGLIILRLGGAAVFLFFGFSQIFDSVAWVSIVPGWAVSILHIPPAMIVLGNGALEVVLGSLLALGFWVRIVSFVLALHLIPITLDMGFTATGARDFGLTLAAFALSFLFPHDVFNAFAHGQAHDQGDEEQHKEDKEENFRNAQ